MIMVLCIFLVMTTNVFAESAAVEVAPAGIESIKEELQLNINIVWTCVAAFMVFFMQAGFAMVETGFTRAKNAVNILMKNLMDFSVGSIAFFAIGFGYFLLPQKNVA